MLRGQKPEASERRGSERGSGLSPTASSSHFPPPEEGGADPTWDWGALCPGTQSLACAVPQGPPPRVTQIGALPPPQPRLPWESLINLSPGFPASPPQHQSQKTLPRSQTWLCPSLPPTSMAPQGPSQSPSWRFPSLQPFLRHSGLCQRQPWLTPSSSLPARRCPETPPQSSPARPPSLGAPPPPPRGQESWRGRAACLPAPVPPAGLSPLQS